MTGGLLHPARYIFVQSDSSLRIQQQGLPRAHRRQPCIAERANPESALMPANREVVATSPELASFTPLGSSEAFGSQ